MSIDNQDFIKRLRSITSDIITDEERLAVYETDGLTAKKQLPGVVVIPDTVEQVQAITALCQSYEVPLVPRELEQVYQVAQCLTMKGCFW